MRPRALGGRAMAAVLLAVALVLALGALAQSKPAEVHGSLDAYATQGLALAWGVLRGRDEASTRVIVLVDAEPAVYGSMSLVGVDPFTRVSQTLMPIRSIGGPFQFFSPRSRFADLPRTEWRFYHSQTPAPGEAPALVVYYLGIPDTTPEFDDEAKLNAYLPDRIERARRDAKDKR
jgi:hypothetical protein